MAHSIKATKQSRVRTPAEAQRAFDAYLRWGRALPSVSLTKSASLSLKALGDIRPTSYYTWRTANDERVRATHAANDGEVFAWNSPPATGHPGHERNCRCWADPYYGTPFISDTTLALRRQQRTDKSGLEPWQLVETVTRPDGSLAESRILMRDGTLIVSTFNGGLVVNEVTLPSGKLVRVERRDGVQAIFVGDNGAPLVLTTWTASGPQIAVPRKRVAEGPFNLLPEPIRPDRTISVGPRPFGEIEALEPGNSSGAALGAAAVTVALALTALYLASQSAPASVGAGTEDKPALTIRIWGPNGKLTPVPVSVTSLTAEQVAQNCKRLPEVQRWTDDATLSLLPRRAAMTAGAWGTLVHSEIEATFNVLKDRYPARYADTWAERSYAPNARPAARSSSGSSRLDIIEIRNDAVCIYDIKTGRDMSSGQLEKYMQLAAAFGKLTFYVIQVKPSSATLRPAQ